MQVLETRGFAHTRLVATTGEKYPINNDVGAGAAMATTSDTRHGTHLMCKYRARVFMCEYLVMHTRTHGFRWGNKRDGVRPYLRCVYRNSCLRTPRCQFEWVDDSVRLKLRCVSGRGRISRKFNYAYDGMEKELRIDGRIRGKFECRSISRRKKSR